MNNRIRELADEYGLNMVILFGSQATGQTHAESDVDIAYHSDAKLDFNQEASLNSDLTGVFKNDKVSLVNLKTAYPLLAKQVVSNGIVLYTNGDIAFSQLYAQALRAYQEAKPLFELCQHYLDYRISKFHHVGPNIYK